MFGRYAEVPVEGMTAEQRAAHRALVEGPRGGVSGPYRAWVTNPALVHALAALDEHVNSERSALSPAEREIAILASAVHWSAEYVIGAHAPRATAAGVPAAAVAAIVAGAAPELDDRRQRVVHDVAMGLADGGVLPPPLYDAAVDVLGHAALADLTVLLGYYTAVAFTVNAYDVPSP
ncbi:MAG TPA: carboxymuconolactone decarboxylase family protein [Baekduia sp.]